VGFRSSVRATKLFPAVHLLPDVPPKSLTLDLMETFYHFSEALAIIKMLPTEK
jgi:hypothetical protein